MIVVVASSTEELQGMEQFEPEEGDGRSETVIRRSAGGIPMIAVPVGVGKVLASIGTLEAIRRWRPAFVVGIGTCKAIRDDLKLGDVLLASQVVQYDMDLRRFGLQRGQTFSPKGNPFGALDVDAVPAAIPSGMHARENSLIGTADRFLVAADVRANPWITDELHLDAVDMESYAIVAAAHAERVPVSIIRAVSDTFCGSRPKSYPAFLADSSRAMCALVPSVQRAE